MYTTGLSNVSGVTASGEGLQSALGEDVEPELEEDLWGADTEDSTVHHISEEVKKQKRKGKGKRRNKHKNKNTTPFLPETYYTSKHTSGITAEHTPLTSALIPTEDPCNSSHLDYCIHGMCKYMEDLKEAVCICMKGYDGERCGIQLLGSQNKEESRGAEVVQTVLVVIAVVLSIISCIAILLMTCAHYKTHRNFLTAYLGASSEKEKLQTPASDIIV